MVSQWNSSGIFPRAHHIAPLQRSPRVPVENEHRARRFHRTDHFMRSKDNEQECEVSAKLVSIYAKRFSPGKCLFILRTWIRKEVVFYS